MLGSKRVVSLTITLAAVLAAALLLLNQSRAQQRQAQGRAANNLSGRDMGSARGSDVQALGFDAQILVNATRMISEGRRTFRSDTFGDEAFWGDTLRLHLAVEGERLGGVGPGVSPRAALEAGLKVDVDALPRALINRLRRGQVNLDDPETTLALLQSNAVVGLTG